MLPTSMTFYTNIGDPNGPAKIVASCASGTPSAPGCATSGGTFTVTEAKRHGRHLPPDRVGVHLGDRQDPDHRERGVQRERQPAAVRVYTLLIADSPVSTRPPTRRRSWGTRRSTAQLLLHPDQPNTPANPYSSDRRVLPLRGRHRRLRHLHQHREHDGNMLANCPGAEVYAVSIDLQVNGVSTGKTAGGQSEDNSTVYLLSPVLVRVPGNGGVNRCRSTRLETGRVPPRRRPVGPRAVSRARDAGQAAMGMVIGLILLITLSAGTLAATAMQHDPLVSNDVVQHLAYRALQSGIDSYLAALNQNPNLDQLQQRQHVDLVEHYVPVVAAPGAQQLGDGDRQHQQPDHREVHVDQPGAVLQHAPAARPGSTAGLDPRLREGAGLRSRRDRQDDLVPELVREPHRPRTGSSTHIFWSNYESTRPRARGRDVRTARTTGTTATRDRTPPTRATSTAPTARRSSSGRTTSSTDPCTPTTRSMSTAGPQLRLELGPLDGDHARPELPVRRPRRRPRDPRRPARAPPPTSGPTTPPPAPTTPSSSRSRRPTPRSPTIAAQNGCLYSGPTTITLSNSGDHRV